MIKQVLLIGAILIDCVSAFPARADSAATVRKTLQGLYDQASAAIDRKDVGGASAVDTANYIAVDANGGKHTLAETQQRAAQLLKRPQIVKLTIHIEKVTLQGGNAIVDTTQHMVMKTMYPKTHHVSIIDQSATTTDIWIKQGTTWRRAHGQTRSVRVTLNGKLKYSSPPVPKPTAR
jgi:hypothetical protein